MQGAVPGARGRQVPRPGATWLAGQRPGDAGHSGKEASYVKPAGPAAEPRCSELRRARPGQGRRGSRSLQAHSPSRAQSPAWRRSVAPSPASFEHGAPTLGSARMAREGRRARSPPGAGARREAPRAEAELGERSAAHRGPGAPRASEVSPPRSPSAAKGRKVTWGRREGRARRGVGTGLALASCSAVRRRLRAGGSRSSGLPRPPLQEARRLRGAAAGPTPRHQSEGGQPRPGFPPARGRGPPQFFRTPRSSRS